MPTLGDVIRSVCEEQRLRELFDGVDARAAWDAFDEDAPWGEACAGYDPEDVRNYLVLIGDGEYAAC
jgi:hypothetical protein